MAHCPNCGLSTVRTKDWACQWCGYPLVSGIFGKTSKTFSELKHERGGETTSTALLIETEPVTEPEIETNQIAEIEASTEPEPTQQTTDDATAVAEIVTDEEPELESVMEQEPTPEEEPEPEPVMEQEPTPAVEPEPKVEESRLVQEVTVAELCSSYQSYGMAGHDEFKDSVFRVKGLVDSVVNKDVVGTYRVALTDNEPHPLGDVYCKFGKEDAAELNRLTVGQELTVEGKYEGFVTNIVLTECVLVG